MIKRSERTFTKDALNTLCRLPDTFAYETDTKATAYESKRTGKTEFIATLSQGKADIAIVIAGMAGALELKMPGRTRAPNQIEWEQRYRRGRGKYAVAYNMTEVLKFWQALHMLAVALKLCEPVEYWKMGIEQENKR